MAEEPRKQVVSTVGSGLRLAATSSKPELHPGWAWGLTAMVVLVGGVTLYAAKAAIGAALDRWLPRLERSAADVPPEVSAALPVPEVDVQPAIEPEWTYVDIEAALRPLPEQTDALIAEGRDEVPQFKGLDSTDEARVLLIRNRWQLWARVWLNRVEHVRRPMPPPEVCEVHAALEPTCRAVRESLALLDRVPAVSNVSEARKLLDAAAAILEQLRQSQLEAEEDVKDLPASDVP